MTAAAIPYIILNITNYTASKYFFGGIPSFNLAKEYISDYKKLIPAGLYFLSWIEILLLIIIPLFLFLIQLLRSKKYSCRDSLSRIRALYSSAGLLLCGALLFLSGTMMQSDPLSILESNTISRFFTQHRIEIKNLSYLRKPVMDNDTLNYVRKKISDKKSSGSRIFSGKTNIILIITESLSARETALYHCKEKILMQNIGESARFNKNITPFLNSIAKNGASSGNFYSNGDYTAGALAAIFCSLYDTLRYSSGIASLVRGYESERYPSLQEILKRHGYSTLFFHGLSNSFDNMGEFLKGTGFEGVYDRAAIIHERKPARWGAPDRALFKKAAHELSSTKEPFFAAILTSSNHPPFDLPPGETKKTWQGYSEIYQDYLNTVNYTDRSIEFFFQIVEKESFFKNTVFIITSDNGVPLLSDIDTGINPVFRSLIIHWVPLIIYLPGNPEIFAGLDLSTGSHVDIAPTILNMLGIEPEARFAGRSLLDKNEGRHVFMYEWFNRFLWLENGRGYANYTGKCFGLDGLEACDCGTGAYENNISAFRDVFNYMIYNDRFYKFSIDTNYEPSLEVFEPDFKTRRKKR